MTELSPEQLEQLSEDYRGKFNLFFIRGQNARDFPKGIPLHKVLTKMAKLMREVEQLKKARKGSFRGSHIPEKSQLPPPPPKVPS